MILTDRQAQVVAEVDKSIRSGDRIIKVGGLAGTGKTTIAVQLPDLLGVHRTDVHFIAPTNKAAIVLNSKLQAAGVFGHATTAHSKFYRPIPHHCAECPYRINSNALCHGTAEYNACGCTLTFNQKELKQEPALFICDESSMVGQILYDDIIETMPHGSTVIFFGDHFQLPPVESGKELAKYGYPTNTRFDLMQDAKIKMDSVDDILRQAKDSPIIQLAHKVRRGEDPGYGEFGEGVRRLPFPEEDNEFDIDIDDPELMILTYFSTVNYYVNTRPKRNWTYHDVNTNIRAARGITGPPRPGERVVCNRNIRAFNVAKGTRAVIDAIQPNDRESYRATLTTEYGQTLSNVLISSKQFEGRLPDGADHLQRWSFAYAQTTHTAQGSEYDSVVIFEPDPGFQRKISSNREYARWLYTGITRAKKHLTIYG